MPRRLIFSALLAGTCLAVALPATALAQSLAAAVEAARSSLEDKRAFANRFAEMVLSIIHDTKKNFKDRKTILREAFAKSVDIDWIARFVLGKSWNQTSPEQKQRYMDTYRRYLTETYVSNFAENPDKRIRDIKIGQVYDANDDDHQDFTVQTEMQLASSEDMRVNYLVNEKDGKYKVRDIAIENVSLINTHRSELSQLAASKGVDHVIEELESRIERMEKGEGNFSVQKAGAF